MDDGLRGLGYSAPRIIAHSVDDGLALIEDFGATTIAEDGVPDGARYAEAVALLAELHGRELPASLPVGDGILRAAGLRHRGDAGRGRARARLVCAGDRAGDAALGRAHAVPGDLARAARADPRRARRPGRCAIFIRPTCIGSPDAEGLKRIGLIDFQDAVLGPPAYDLASLLQDARVDVPEDLEMRLAALYMRRRAAADPAFDAQSFAAAYAAMGAQRATKILGIFARLDKRDGKPEYLRHLPRIERYLARNLAHPLLRPLALWYQNHLPRALGPPPVKSDP